VWEHPGSSFTTTVFREAAMTQKIDPAKLKAAAERLEWVCQQYPNEESVQHVLKVMQPMIDDAKAGRILEPIPDRFELPFRWAMSSEGLFREFADPDLESAYVDFGIELEGGLSEQEKRILAKFEARVAAKSKGIGNAS
jgi:hypothetical protein